jgi:hypothetical protein
MRSNSIVPMLPGCALAAMIPIPIVSWLGGVYE